MSLHIFVLEFLSNYYYDSKRVSSDEFFNI